MEEPPPLQYKNSSQTQIALADHLLGHFPRDHRGCVVPAGIKMRLLVNGQEFQIADGATVAELIVQYRLTPEKVAVELNRRLLRSDKYGTILKDGDQVEIVTFVGGG